MAPIAMNHRTLVAALVVVVVLAAIITAFAAARSQQERPDGGHTWEGPTDVELTVPDYPVVIKMFPTKEGMSITEVRRTMAEKGVVGTYVDADEANTAANLGH